MGLFGGIGKIVSLPIAVVHDVVTLGGALTDDEAATTQVIRDIKDEITE